MFRTRPPAFAIACVAVWLLAMSVDTLLLASAEQLSLQAQLRWKLLSTGRMPDTETWSRPWYETPNIHPCTLLDFVALAEMDGYLIEEWLAVDERGLRAPWRRSIRLANLFGEQALFKLRRK